jgi:hypothetical protein
MCNVINESREERCNPRPWGATEVSHQLIAPDGEVARCGGSLLVITLHACVEECGGCATGPTGGGTAANLSRGISWVTSGGGRHDAQRCPIKVAPLRLALCSCHGTIESANLLNGCDGCTRSAPGFKERCNILIIGDRQEELAHAPQGVWRVEERVAADRLNAPANLRIPLCSKCWRDGGEDADLCSELQCTCWRGGSEYPVNLCADAFTREARSEWGIAPDRCGGPWLQRQVEPRDKPDRAKHAQRIFKESFGGISNGAQ